MLVSESEARAVLLEGRIGRELPELPEHALRIGSRSDLLTMRVTPDRVEQMIWTVDTFAELCDRYRQEHRVPFRAARGAGGLIDVGDLETAARYVGLWSHFAHGAVVGLDAALVVALDDHDGVIARAGEPGSERWDAILARAGIFGARVADHAKTFQFMYRLQVGVIRIFCRSGSLAEWLDSVAAGLDGKAGAGSRACPCGCETR